MVRSPIVAGQFYPAGKEELEEEIRKSFNHKFGPGSLPGKRQSDKKVYGVIAPHAGYAFSGAGAAWCYKEIGEAKFPDTYVILGVNHPGTSTCASDEDWETPLGTVKCDNELVSAMEKKGLPVDNGQHSQEHSIEAQLPFLQFVSGNKKDDLQIACIMIADDAHEKWADIISSAVEALGRNVVYICSSDFTHYGYSYGYVPFEDNVKENMEKLDREAIKLIEKSDAEGFLQHCSKTGATICGKHSIAALIQLMEGKKAELLKYYTSGDVLGDYGNAVGYASIVFR